MLPPVLKSGNIKYLYFTIDRISHTAFKLVKFSLRLKNSKNIDFANFLIGKGKKTLLLVSKISQMPDSF